TQVTVASHDVISLETISRPEHVNEANLAAAYASQLQYKARYCFDNKDWYLWDGTRWKQDKQRQLLQLTTEFVQLAAKCAIEKAEPDVARRILTFLSAQKLENIEKLAQPKLALSLTDFETNPRKRCKIPANQFVAHELTRRMMPNSVAGCCLRHHRQLRRGQWQQVT
ncbi:MAG: hypothetical protein VX702_00680, partial [Pseudomonadota bacterium]|nr:hypothetical protein [Pseudomonadota bacterium]